MEDKRVTIKEISKIVNVSPTTVTKALTGKKQVSEEKRALIIKTAQELGYKPNKYARALVKKDLTIGIVISEEPREFVTYLVKGLQHGIDELFDLKVKGVFRFFRDNNATGETVEALRYVMDQGVDGLIFAPGFHSEDYGPLMHEIIGQRNNPVLYIEQIVGEESGIGCVKSNARVMGGMAAEYLGLCLPQGSGVAVFTTDREYMHHREILQEFSAEAERSGRFCIRTVLENKDSAAIVHEQAEYVLRNFPDIRGIYVTSYNSVPVCECLIRHGMQDKIVVIGHDLYPELVPYIKSGALNASIFQNPFLQGRRAVKALYEYLTERKSPGEILIKPELILKSNLECYTTGL